MSYELPSDPTAEQKLLAMNSFMQEWLGTDAAGKEAIANRYFQQIKGFRKVVNDIRDDLEAGNIDFAYNLFHRNIERASRGQRLLGCARALSLAFEYRYPGSLSGAVVTRLLVELEENSYIPTSIDAIISMNEMDTLVEDISLLVATVDPEIAVDLRFVIAFLLQDLAKLHINRNDPESISSTRAYNSAITLVAENHPQSPLSGIPWETYFGELAARIEGCFNRVLSRLASQGPVEA